VARQLGLNAARQARQPETEEFLERQMVGRPFEISPRDDFAGSDGFFCWPNTTAGRLQNSLHLIE